VTFSIEDHRILIASAWSQQEALSPQDFSIDFDPLPAIRSALVLGGAQPSAQVRHRLRQRRVHVHASARPRRHDKGPEPSLPTVTVTVPISPTSTCASWPGGGSSSRTVGVCL